MSAISGYQSAISLEQLQAEAASPAEVLEKVLEALQTAGISVDEMTNPDELRAALAEALGELDFDAATPAEVLAAVESALDARGLSLTNIAGAAASPAEVADVIAAALPDIAQAVKAVVEELGIPAVPDGLATKSDLDAVHSDVLATKAAVEGIEIPAGPSREDLTAAARAAIVAEGVATSSDVAAVKAVVDEIDPLDEAETVDAVETAIDNKNLPNRTDLQAVADLVSQVKTLVEGLETGGGGGVDLEDVQAAVEAALEDRNLSLADIADIAASPTEVQTVIESVLQNWQPPGAGPLPGEVRAFAGEIPEGWEQVQGPTYDLSAGIPVIRRPARAALEAFLEDSAPFGNPTAATEGGKLYVHWSDFYMPGVIARYDLSNDDWTALAQAPDARDNACLVGLGDGRLLLLGGNILDQYTFEHSPVFECQVYDIDTGTWSGVASLPEDVIEGWGDCKAALLPNGNVLAVTSTGAICEYDPVTNQWSLKESEFGSYGNFSLVVHVLPSGKVFLMGVHYGSVAQWAIYDVDTDTFTASPTSAPEFTGLVGAAVPHEDGCLLYKADSAYIFDEDSKAFTLIEGYAGLNPYNNVYVPGEGLYWISHVEEGPRLLPDASIPTPVRYARKL